MDLRLDLIVAATVMEVELPEKEQWRVDVEKGREEREKLTSLVASSGECVSTFNSVPQINSPIFLHDLRHDPKSRPPISPFEHLGSLGSRRAEQLGRGDHSDAAKIKAVAVPARLDRYITFDQPVRMGNTGFVQKREVGIRQIEKVSA